MAEHHIDDRELDRLWNDLIAGRAPAHPYRLARPVEDEVRLFHSLATTPLVEAARERLDRRVLAEIDRHAKERSVNGVPSLTVVPSTLRQPRTRPATGAWSPGRVLAGGSAVFSRLAIVAVLLVTLGLGYLAFGPRGESGQPSSVPAVAPLGTPGATVVASPTRTYPRSGHPIIGTWLVTNGEGNVFYAIFGSNGTYLETADNGYLGIGIWRATGKRTAEIITSPGSMNLSNDMFTPGYVVPPDGLVVHDTGLSRAEVEVDADGNGFTASSVAEQPDGNGGVTQSDPGTATGRRLKVVPIPIVTPTP